MPEVETRKEAEKQDGRVGFWLKEIERAAKREHDWRQEARQVVERYRVEKKRRRGFNLLWSNIETLKPAVFSQLPEPAVRRRFFDQDPVGREAAEILERALAFTTDDPEYDFTASVVAARDDTLLTGRGVARVIYEPVMIKRELQMLALGDQLVPIEEPDGFADEEAKTGPFREEIGEQHVYCGYVYWEDYREGPARNWEDVPWVAYRHLMIRAELKRQFGEVGAVVRLDHDGEADRDSKDRSKDDPEAPVNRARVWEIWDKERKERVWVAESHKDAVLRTDDDPLGLQGFFPQPNPLYGITTTDSRVPVPEFLIYKDQADELDDITMRISLLIQALKVRGIYAAVIKEIGDLLDGEENKLYPAEDWASIQDKGGLEKCMAFLPIEQIAKVLSGLFEQRDRLKQEIFELTGLSDIIRGSSDPRETATGQRLKGNFGTFRMQPRRAPMERFIRDLMRIKAELIAEHFEPEMLQRMTNRPVAPEVMQLLRDDKLRGFRIDIETDSTVQPDREQEKQSVVEFLSASAEFIAKAQEAAANEPLLVRLYGEMFKSAARRFKMGRELEQVIEETMDQLTQKANGAQQGQQQQDPRVQLAQQQLQLEAQEVQGEQQLKGQVAKAEFGLKVQEVQSDADLDTRRLEGELEIKAQAAQDKALNDELKARIASAVAQQSRTVN